MDMYCRESSDIGWFLFSDATFAQQLLCLQLYSGVGRPLLQLFLTLCRYLNQEGRVPAPWWVLDT